MTTKFKIVIREEDLLKVRKKHAPPSKPFKNKKLYSRSKVRKTQGRSLVFLNLVS